MKLWIAVAGSLVIFAVSPAARGQTADAQLTVQRYVAAQNAGDLEVALEVWADDGTIINTRGRSITGRPVFRNAPLFYTNTERYHVTKKS
jgi:hypothetical protein